MKYFLAFASGCVLGALGTLVYLRKDIKQKMAQNAFSCEIEASGSEDAEKVTENKKNDDNSDEKPEISNPVVGFDKVGKKTMNTMKTRYDSLVRAETRGEIPVVPEEDKEWEDPDKDFYDDLKNRDRFEPIHDMSEWDDPMFNKEEYVYFRGDNVLCTDNGTIIERPVLMVGNEWQQHIGAFKNMAHTALIRDNKRIMNIEIYVEDGLYSDEYGDFAPSTFEEE